MSSNFYTYVGRQKDDLLVRRIEDGKRITERIPYKPTLYLIDQSGNPSQYRTLHGDPLVPVLLSTMSESRELIEMQAEMGNPPVYGNTNFPYVYIAENYSGTVDYDSKQFKIANLDIETAAEKEYSKPEDAFEKVISITIKMIGENHFTVFGLNPFDPPGEVDYRQYPTEKEMLQAFLDFWTEDYPDAVTGWNTSGYDIPYLYNRITKVLGKKAANSLSPFNYVRAITRQRFDEEKTTFLLTGINDLDYLQIYRKNVLEPLESYTLDYVADYELEEQKLDYFEYRSLWEMYQKNHQKFIEYNIHDVRLVEMIEAKRRLIELQFLIAYRCKVNPEDVMSQVRTWDTSIFNFLRDQDVVVPMVDVEEKDKQYEGAFVKIPEPGMYKWIASFDVASLYPSLIATLNIGVETKQDVSNLDSVQRKIQKDASVKNWLAEKKPDWSVMPDWSLGANGAMYSKDRQSVYTTLIVALLEERKKYRKLAGDAGKLLQEIKTDIHEHGETPERLQRKHDAEYDLANYDLKQKSIKVLNNSLYGCVGNEFFRFFDIDNAEAITVTGRFVIQHVAKGLNRFLNKKVGTENEEYVFYIDTDSNYIVLDRLVQKYLPTETDPYKISAWLDKVCKQIIEAEINRLFEEIINEYLNGNHGFLSMKREVIGDKGIWTGKKRYAIRIIDEEGKIKRPMECKYMGLEIKRSTTPKICKEAMIRGCELIFDEDQEGLFDHVQQFHRGYSKKKYSVVEIAQPTGVKGLDKYADPRAIYLKGCPIHVRAALMYNHLLRHFHLDNVYAPIRNGDKIKYVRLKEINPTNQNVMAVVGGFPAEFQLDDYVDYETMYEKTFFEAMKRISDAAGFDLVRRANIESLFS